MAEQKIGKITHYFDKIGVGVIEITAGDLAVGDTIKIKEGEKEFEQIVTSLQIDRHNVAGVRVGQQVGLKLDQPVKAGYQVYKTE
jgi:translation initiation factor IF-2